MAHYSGKPTLLVVDDDSINQELLGDALRDDYYVLTASSGEEALRLAETELPDTILLDIVMPDLDGYQVCQALKLNMATKDIPVIFSTAKCTLEEEILGLNSGASDYVTKPYNLALVRARVRNQVLLKQKTDLLEQLANIDALTKVPNRRYFDEVFELEWRRASRNSYPISLAIFDIDFFKLFNDNFGHVAGDDCLVRVSRALSSKNRRAGDVVARYGGEEFIFIWPNCPLSKAMELAEEIRAGVEKLALTHPYSQVHDVVTVSGGVATVYPSLAKDKVDVIKVADEQLYKSKHAGRNQVTGAEC